MLKRKADFQLGSPITKFFKVISFNSIEPEAISTSFIAKKTPPSSQETLACIETLPSIELETMLLEKK